ncbi:MAG: hypothetical protein ACTHJJ_16370, partial [Intrasporangium sp.]|uniref:hypothetical protein n=1 Tax=Intrasporangium sp. TaxID=1925024 RepID=UPI003F7E392F
DLVEVAEERHRGCLHRSHLRRVAHVGRLGCEYVGPDRLLIVLGSIVWIAAMAARLPAGMSPSPLPVPAAFTARGPTPALGPRAMANAHSRVDRFHCIGVGPSPRVLSIRVRRA